MQSRVLAPIIFSGASRLMFWGSWDALADKASTASRRPGIIMPPRKSPLPSMTETVVEVPISTTIMGLGYLAQAATASTTRSLPTWAGLSVLMFRPVFTPEPTSRGRLPVRRSTASRSTGRSTGTTEEIMPPSRSPGEMPPMAKIPERSRVYSSAVLERSVARRKEETSCFPSKQPATIWVFPMSMAKITGRPLLPRRQCAGISGCFSHRAAAGRGAAGSAPDRFSAHNRGAPWKSDCR